MNTDKLAIN